MNRIKIDSKNEKVSIRAKKVKNQFFHLIYTILYIQCRKFLSNKRSHIIVPLSSITLVYLI